MTVKGNTVIVYHSSRKSVEETGSWLRSTSRQGKGGRETEWRKQLGVWDRPPTPCAGPHFSSPSSSFSLLIYSSTSLIIFVFFVSIAPVFTSVTSTSTLALCRKLSLPFLLSGMADLMVHVENNLFIFVRKPVKGSSDGGTLICVLTFFGSALRAVTHVPIDLLTRYEGSMSLVRFNRSRSRSYLDLGWGSFFLFI